MRASAWYPAATAEQARQTLQLLRSEDAASTPSSAGAGKASATAKASPSRASLRYWAYCYLSVVVWGCVFMASEQQTFLDIFAYRRPEHW